MTVKQGLRDFVLAPMPTEHTVLTVELLDEQVDEWLRRSGWEHLQVPPLEVLLYGEVG